MKTNFASVYNDTHQTAKRIESELGEEQFMFAHSNEYEWHALPHPDEPLTASIDGGCIVLQIARLFVPSRDCPESHK
jgi:hypothetical protein